MILDTLFLCTCFIAFGPPLLLGLLRYLPAKVDRVLLAFSCGLMLSHLLVHDIPHSHDSQLILIGFLSAYCMHIFHSHAAVAYIVLNGLIHGLTHGIVLASGFNTKKGIHTFSLLLLHDIPHCVANFSMMRHIHLTSKQMFAIQVLIGISTFAGAYGISFDAQKMSALVAGSLLQFVCSALFEKKSSYELTALLIGVMVHLF